MQLMVNRAQNNTFRKTDLSYDMFDGTTKLQIEGQIRHPVAILNYLQSVCGILVVNDSHPTVSIRKCRAAIYHTMLIDQLMIELSEVGPLVVIPWG